MRLSNFSIFAGNVTVSDLTTTLPHGNLVVSGVIGDSVTNLKRAANNNLYTFAQHHGDDVDENPYGNVRLYNSGVVNVSTELAMSQSFSSPITGSATVSFVFIADLQNRG